MADFSFNPHAALRAHENSYDGGGRAVQLAVLPRSRASSYTSHTNHSFYDADNDDAALLTHARSISGTEPLELAADDKVARVVSQTSTVRADRKRKKRLQGWRFGVACSAAVATTVFVVNFILTIVGAAKFATVGGVGTAYNGSCETTDTWATAAHILINVLSSILLSASNYTMQCLSSPTRAEIDKAHARGDWVDIGVASVRNILGRIGLRRTISWWVLALSSIPIHLLYNSAIFKSLDSNYYSLAVANDDFLSGHPYNATLANGFDPVFDDLDDFQHFFSNVSNRNNPDIIVNLNVSHCLSVYGTDFVTGHGDVLLVTSEQGRNQNDSIFYLQDSVGETSGFGPPYSWICEDTTLGSGCDIATARKNAIEAKASVVSKKCWELATHWTVGGAKIEYCLARVEAAHCKLQFCTQILAAVVVCNFFKAATMFWTLFQQRDPTLVTIGDAVASFLETPDNLTRGRCLMSKSDVHKGPLQWRQQGWQRPYTSPLPITFQSTRRRRWNSAASTKRWCITLGLCLAGLIASVALLADGVKSIQSSSGVSAWSLGFGSVNSYALIDTGLTTSGSKGLIIAVLLSNCPQAICSFLYLAYNGLLTSMLLASEWSRYFIRPKPLRVTTPRGRQRSSYYLQLPFTYSIPLLIASGTLHWLISESIFLARIDVWHDGQAMPAENTSQTGFSCIPILLTFFLGISMLSFAVGLGMRKFQSLMPVVGSCSVAISAACHRPNDDLDAAFLPVSWGEVPDEGSCGIGHCCFTSHDVQDLVPKRMYAGINVQ